MPLQLEKRSFVGRYFELTLDGQKAGLIRSVDGGGIKGELIAQQIGGQPFRIKHVNNPVVEPITIQVGMTMSKGFYSWIESSWAGKAERRNGSIMIYDYDWKPQFEYTFYDALILETQFPAFDGSSKEPYFMTVKFQPERAENKFDPSGGRPAPSDNKIQKQALPCNFRFELGEVDLRRVSKIDAITVKQNAKPMSCGPDWMYQLEPTSLEFPNVTVYCSMVDSKPLYDWHKSFVIDGKNGPEEEKTGSITALTTNLQDELFTIDLHSVGILNVVQEKGDAGSDPTVKRVKAELYVEEMRISYKAGMR